MTRQELLDLVWSTPIDTLCKEFGISNVGFAKVCRRHLVPVPPRGYWNKVAAGKPVMRKPQLPRAADPRLYQVGLVRKPSHEPTPVELAVSKRRAELRSIKAAPPHQSVDTLPIHPKIEPTARAIRELKPDSEGRITLSGPRVCSLRVGPESVGRTLRFLNSFAHYISVAGLEMVPGDDGLSICKSGYSAILRVTERRLRAKHVPTVAELHAYEQYRKRRYNYMSGEGRYENHRSRSDFWTDWDYSYTGLLAVEIEVRRPFQSRRFSDGKSQRVEQLLDAIVIAFELMRARHEAEAEEENRRKERLKALEARRQRLQQRKEREERREKLVERLAADRTEIRRLKEWHADLASDGRLQDAGPETARLLEWLRRRAEALEAKWHPDRLRTLLAREALFPDPDPLADPADS